MQKKFDQLMRWVSGGNNFVRAYHSVMRNDGAAGVDGVKTEDLPQLLNHKWESIAIAINNGNYQPQPIRAVTIPKPNGGKRKLGIPTVVDRLIQQSIHQVLSPIFEKDFSQFSYGFLKGRNAHQALAQANDYINEGFHWIIDLDLKSFFDEVHHDKLMGLIAKRVSDKKLLQLIRRYLQRGAVVNGKIEKRLKGTPQGGPLSPLLSNILLNELDKELEKRGHRFVRYADDCSIFLKSQRAAQRVLKSITNFLERKLYLKVNDQKTSICRPIHFKLLGHGFIPTYRKGEKGKYQLRISAKSWQRLKQKIKQLTKKTEPIPFTERITRLNQLMRGWVNYFKNATGYQKLKDLDAWVRCRLRYCIWKQWKRPKRRLRAFLQLGISPSWAKRFAYSRKGGWAIACSPIMGMSVTEDRLRQKGYTPFLEYYLKAKYSNSEKKMISSFSEFS